MPHRGKDAQPQYNRGFASRVLGTKGALDRELSKAAGIQLSVLSFYIYFILWS